MPAPDLRARSQWRAEEQTLRPAHEHPGRPGLPPPVKQQGRTHPQARASLPPSLPALFVMTYKLFPPRAGLDCKQLYVGVGSILSGPVVYLLYPELRRAGRSAA